MRDDDLLSKSRPSKFIVTAVTLALALLGVEIPSATGQCPEGEFSCDSDGACVPDEVACDGELQERSPSTCLQLVLSYCGQLTHTRCPLLVATQARPWHLWPPASMTLAAAAAAFYGKPSA